MAFVFRAEKKDPDHSKKKVPGPGQYITHTAYQFEENKIPFISTVDKPQIAPKMDENPGPGSYNITNNIAAQQKMPNIFFVPANAEGEYENISGTNTFKSKSIRFKNQNDNGVPGPGKYNTKSTLVKDPQNLGPARSAKLTHVQEILKMGKAGVPSIPSNAHSYGYTENDEHELVLNKNPLLQVQQYVGPGYYEAKVVPDNLKYKGPAWHKSGVKKGAAMMSKTATTTIVGPGTYDPNDQGHLAYKSNPHPAFISTSTRSFDVHVKSKLGLGKFNSRTPGSSQSAIDRRISQVETDADDSDGDEYIKDATPGPGHYHNDSLMSSFGIRTPHSDISSISGSKRNSNRSANKPLAFGRTQRFKQPVTTTNQIGPGDYEVNPKTKKLNVKYAKTPFLSSNVRFEREEVTLQPGPGTYDPPINIVHRIQDKARSGYAGSFGVTDKRFKVSKLLEEMPGPGTYDTEKQKGKLEEAAAAFKKGSHYFVSDSQRVDFALKQNNTAGPGAYDLQFYNIVKIKEKDDEDLGTDLPKKAAFNTSQPRFPQPKEKPIPEDDEEEEDELWSGATRNLDSLLAGKRKQKPSAVFQSKTKRIGAGKGAQFPGPGAYHDPTKNLWNKETFNIHFTGP